MSENIIQINNMNKWFGDFQVLKGINLEVKPKQKIKQKNEIIKVKDNPPHAPVSTQFKPSNFPNSIVSSKKRKYFNKI